MYIAFSFPDSRRMEGVVLSIRFGYMRVAVPGQTDSMEFHLTDGYWTSENGERVELDSLVAIAGIEADHLSASKPAVTSAAGLTMYS